MSDYTFCTKCGIFEHIHLLDAKSPDCNENGDFTLLECIACYGPGWCPTAGPTDIALSIQPKLLWRYWLWAVREWWREKRRVVAKWRHDTAFVEELFRRGPSA